MRDLLKIKFDTKRAYGLDILRAGAILSVIAAHGAKITPQRTWSFQNDVFPDGVFLFFVLSGYLIGGILIKILENNKATPKNLGNFWVRRWFRTIPAYFLILTVLIIMRNLFNGGLPAGTGIYRYYLFIQNFHTPHPIFYSEVWTLSIEEWFYLLVPATIFLLVGVFKLKPKRAIISTAVAIIIASIAFRLYRYSMHPPTSIAEWDSYYRKEVVTRLDSLMFGLVGAYFTYYHKPLWIRHKVVLFWAGLALIITQQAVGDFIGSGQHINQSGFGLYLSVFSFTVMALGTLLLLPLLSEISSGKGFVYKALTYVSITSYSMYLIHVSLIQPFVYDVTNVPVTHLLMAVRYVMYWVLTIIGSILLYKYFEKPSTGLREKLVRKQYKSAPPEPPR